MDAQLENEVRTELLKQLPAASSANYRIKVEEFAYPSAETPGHKTDEESLNRIVLVKILPGSLHRPHAGVATSFEYSISERLTYDQFMERARIQIADLVDFIETDPSVCPEIKRLVEHKEDLPCQEKSPLTESTD